MVAVIAGTPYQMINSLNLVKSQGKECVLFIRFIEKNTNRIAGNFNIENIKEDFIKDIYYFDVTSFETPGLLKRIFYKLIYGEKNKIKLYIPDINLKYKFDEVILPKWETFYGIFSSLCAKNVKYCAIEDGIGDYIYDDLLEDSSDCPAVYPDFDTRYMTAPTLYHKKTAFEVKALPKLLKDTMPKSLSEFFKWDEKQNKFNKFVYFTQMFDALPVQTECPRLEKEFFDILNDTVGEERITVKLHPRSEANMYGNNGIVSLTPWELISALSEDIEDKVLISMCSGSVFFTKLLCGKEPYVICLIKLYAPYIYCDTGEDDEEQRRTLEFINGVKDSYKDKNRFFIPETPDEFRQILEDIKQGRI